MEIDNKQDPASSCFIPIEWVIAGYALQQMRSHCRMNLIMHLNL